MRVVPVNSATADKSEQESFDLAQDGSLDPFDCAQDKLSGLAMTGANLRSSAPRVRYVAGERRNSYEL
jgi:hypothetical protein